MKKRLFIALFALCAGGVLSGCRFAKIDWSSFNYYVWVNDSSHSITLSVEGTRFESSDGELNVTLAPGERYEDWNTLGQSHVPPGRYWKVTVLFDDETYGAEFYWHWEAGENGDGSWKLLPDGYDERYNPVIEENYASEEVKNPNGCRQCSGRRWTYTFTDADYEAAVEYGSREPSEE